jgi:hypothetical protein
MRARECPRFFCRFSLKDVMKTLPSTAFGAAFGTLLYTGFLSTAHAFDWGRAAFVGVCCGIVSAAWSRKKPAQ